MLYRSNGRLAGVSEHPRATRHGTDGDQAGQENDGKIRRADKTRRTLGNRRAGVSEPKNEVPCRLLSLCHNIHAACFTRSQCPASRSKACGAVFSLLDSRGLVIGLVKPCIYLQCEAGILHKPISPCKTPSFEDLQTGWTGAHPANGLIGLHMEHSPSLCRSHRVKRVKAKLQSSATSGTSLRLGQSTRVSDHVQPHAILATNDGQVRLLRPAHSVDDSAVHRSKLGMYFGR